MAPGRCTRQNARTAPRNARYRSSPPRAARYIAGIASRSIALRDSSEIRTVIGPGDRDQSLKRPDFFRAEISFPSKASHDYDTGSIGDCLSVGKDRSIGPHHVPKRNPPLTGRVFRGLNPGRASIFNLPTRTGNDFVFLSGHILVFSSRYPPDFLDTPRRFFYCDSYGRNLLHPSFSCMLPFRNLHPVRGSYSI